MATQAHYIFSEYKPEDRDRLEIETGQCVDSNADPWLSEKAFGGSKRIGNPPKFVAAKHRVDDWTATAPQAGPDDSQKDGGQSDSDNVSGWYRSLVQKRSSATLLKISDSKSPTPTPGQRVEPCNIEKRHKRDRNSWFISRVLDSAHSETSVSTSPATIADILTRDPPPFSSEKPFVPPVWLAIGPGNKGFSMLERHGWQEGEALGKHASRQIPLRQKSKMRVDNKRFNVSSAMRETFGESSNHSVATLIDLTGSDEEDSMPTNLASKLADGHLFNTVEDSLEDGGDDDHHGRALITPLPTILKTDRLGIGLKAKTSGPYRESIKRVTHSQAALAAHLKANEDLKKVKKAIGRGRRGFERISKKEGERRKRMLSYLNSD